MERWGENFVMRCEVLGRGYHHLTFLREFRESEVKESVSLPWGISRRRFLVV